MDIEIKINDFEGPLDLLLHLIKINDVDIMDIPIVEITDQYLAYLDKEKKMNLEIASSYLVMASELIEIKSKLLLPRKEDEEVVEDEDPRTELVNRLLEYESYKEASKLLKEKEEFKSEIFTKLPESISEYLDQDTHIESDLSLDDLTEALRLFLQRKKEEKPLKTKITSKEVSVKSRSLEIKRVLSKKKRASFFEFFDVITKEYVVATFLAILEMAKNKELKIVQDENFGEIICEGV